jgi:hypothetical protein
LALAKSTTDAKTRAALIIMAQKLYYMASGVGPSDLELAQREFNDRQMVQQPTMQRRLVMQQQQQMQPKKED